MRIDELFYGGESKAETSRRTSGGGCLEEAFENGSQELGIDSRPVVVDSEHSLVCGGTDGDTHPGATIATATMS